MKVRLFERVSHDGQRFESDEIRVVPDDVGAYFCRLGWAEDAAGIVPTGERKAGAVRLTVESVAIEARGARGAK